MKYSPLVLCFSVGFFLNHSGVLRAQNIKNEKMKVEVWSDVVCPFCYIGKTHFDEALAQFEGKDFSAFLVTSHRNSLTCSVRVV